MSKKIKLCILALLISIISVLAFPVKADENEWSTNGPYGGSIKTIAIKPFSSETVYIGTIVNGIYKSTDGGSNWSHLDSDILYNTMRVITFHPLEPDTVYAATAGGIYKSSDSGENWVQLYPPQNQDGEYRALLIHPIESSLIFTGGPIYTWMSIDGGQNWFRPDIALNIGTSALAVDYDNPNIIYMVASSFANGLGIWKSEDRGITWSNIQNNIDTSGFGSDIEIDPISSNTLYLSRTNLFDSSCLSKSINGGQSWLDITPEEISSPEIKVVKVSPYDNNTVFICTKNDGVLKSADGGESWRTINNGLKVTQTASMEFDTTNRIIYLGTYHDGIYKSTDDGENWQKISLNISCVETRDLAVSNLNPNFAVVASRNGVYCTNNCGLSWDYVNVGFPLEHSAMTVCFDEQDPDNIYLATVREFYNSQEETGFYRSTDNGTSWQFFNTGLPGEKSYIDIAVSNLSVEEVKRIFLASSQGLYYSDDIGESWELCANGLPTNEYYVVVEVAPDNPYTIAVGDANNRVFISHNWGDSWSQTEELPTPQWEYINDIEFHPHNTEHIYIGSYYQGLFESIDSGQSWTNINNNLPVDPEITIISGIAINSLNSSNMFVASNHYGVYQSHDGGQSWEAFNAGLDTTDGVGEMMFAPGDTTILYFATSMRSVWSITRTPTGIEMEDLPLADEISLTSYPNPFNAQTKITYYIPESGNVNVTIYDITGRKVEVIVDDFMSAGNHELTWDASVLAQTGRMASGIYFCTLKAGKISKTESLVLLK